MKHITKSGVNKLENLYIKLQKEHGIDIANRSRKRTYIEFRSIFNTVAFKTYLIGHSDICRFYESKGFKLVPASVLHSIDMFKVYYTDKRELLDIFFDISPTAKKLFEYRNTYKYVYMNHRLTNIQKLVSNLTEHQVEELTEMIELKKKSWGWKSLDKCEEIVSTDGISQNVF